jgi:hypothetical protein
MARPTIHEFFSEQELIQAAHDYKNRGVSDSDLYVLTHEKDETKQLADVSDTNTIGLKEEGLGTAITNIFNKRGDELRNKLEEIGLTQTEAQEYERKLDTGAMLLIVKDPSLSL